MSVVHQYWRCLYNSCAACTAAALRRTRMQLPQRAFAATPPAEREHNARPRMQIRSSIAMHNTRALAASEHSPARHCTRITAVRNFRYFGQLLQFVYFLFVDGGSLGPQRVRWARWARSEFAGTTAQKL